jgi:hypothetical protein
MELPLCFRTGVCPSCRTHSLQGTIPLSFIPWHVRKVMRMRGFADQTGSVFPSLEVSSMSAKNSSTELPILTDGSSLRSLVVARMRHSCQVSLGWTQRTEDNARIFSNILGNAPPPSPFLKTRRAVASDSRF